MEKYRVGILGATGMVGQRFVTLLADHPWFEICALAASSRSAGKTYGEALEGRWKLTEPMPECVKEMTVMDVAEVEKVASGVDLVFSAVDMTKEEIRAIEEAYARTETVVVSNNSAHRWTPDVPMIIPEINPEHLDVLEFQKKRLGTKNGCIVVKPNCSIQSYTPMLHALRQFEPERCVVSTYQAISGAGKTFKDWPEIIDNVIPYIGGEEEKSEKEPLRIWGHIESGAIVPAASPVISAQCYRVPVTDGHMASVSVSFKKKPSKDEILGAWAEYSGLPQQLRLPHAPARFIHYFEEDNRPQTHLDRDIEGGMAVCAGRLREDSIFDWKFAGLSHNTLRGAAGGGVLTAELLAATGRVAHK